MNENEARVQSNKQEHETIILDMTRCENIEFIKIPICIVAILYIKLEQM